MDWCPTPGDALAIKQAKAVCADCPVAAACLAAAVEFENGVHKAYRYGIFGGTTGEERYLLHRRSLKAAHRQQQQEERQPKERQPKKRKPAACGTPAGYQRHLRDQTEVCAPCRKANTDADNRLRRTGTSKAAR